MKAKCRTELKLHVGQDNRGHWTVEEEHKRCGGVFLSRADALKYAMLVHSRHPKTVIVVSES